MFDIKGVNLIWARKTQKNYAGSLVSVGYLEFNRFIALGVDVQRGAFTPLLRERTL